MFAVNEPQIFANVSVNGQYTGIVQSTGNECRFLENIHFYFTSERVTWFKYMDGMELFLITGVCNKFVITKRSLYMVTSL